MRSSSKAIAPLGQVLGLGKATDAAYLDLDRSTAHRLAAKNQLLPMHAAKGVVRFLELDQMACDTFEPDAEASQRLRHHHPLLDGDTRLNQRGAPPSLTRGSCPHRPIPLAHQPRTKRRRLLPLTVAAIRRTLRKSPPFCEQT